MSKRTRFMLTTLQLLVLAILLIGIASAYEPPAECEGRWIDVSSDYVVPPDAESPVCLNVTADINKITTVSNLYELYTGDLVIKLNGHRVGQVLYPSCFESSTTKIYDGVVETLVPAGRGTLPCLVETHPNVYLYDVDIDYYGYVYGHLYAYDGTMNDLYICGDGNFVDVTFNFDALGLTNINGDQIWTVTHDVNDPVVFFTSPYEQNLHISNIESDDYVVVCGGNNPITIDVNGSAKVVLVGGIETPYSGRVTLLINNIGVGNEANLYLGVLQIGVFKTVIETISSRFIKIGSTKPLTINLYSFNGQDLALDRTVINTINDDLNVVLHAYSITTTRELYTGDPLDTVTVDSIVTQTTDTLTLRIHGVYESDAGRLYVRSIDAERMNVQLATYSSQFACKPSAEIYITGTGQFPTYLSISSVRTYLYNAKPDHPVLVSCGSGCGLTIRGQTDWTKFMTENQSCIVNESTYEPEIPTTCLEANDIEYYLTYFTGCYHLRNINRIHIYPKLGESNKIEINLDGNTDLIDIYGSEVNMPMELVIENGTIGAIDLSKANEINLTKIVIKNVVADEIKLVGLCQDIYIEESEINTLTYSSSGECQNNPSLVIRNTTVKNLVRLRDYFNIKLYDVNLPRNVCIYNSFGGVFDINNVKMDGYPLTVISPVDLGNADVLDDNRAYILFEPDPLTTWVASSSHKMIRHLIIAGLVPEISIINVDINNLIYGDDMLNLLRVSIENGNLIINGTCYKQPIRVKHMINSSLVAPKVEITEYDENYNDLRDSNILADEITFMRPIYRYEVNAAGTRIKTNNLVFTEVGGITVNLKELTTGHITTIGWIPSRVELLVEKLFGNDSTLAIGLFSTQPSILSIRGSLLEFNTMFVLSSSLYFLGNSRVVLDSVRSGGTIYVECEVAGFSRPPIITLTGTTNPSKFIFSDTCQVEDLTIKSNLYGSLTINGSTSTQKIEEGSPIYIDINVCNGENNVSNVPVTLYIDSGYNRIVRIYTVDQLEQNSCVMIHDELNLPSSPDAWRIYAVIDENDNIPETDESDNITNDVYVYVVRYDPVCGPLTTGWYEFTTAKTIDENDPEPCYTVPEGELVTIADMQVDAPSDAYIVLEINGTAKLVNVNTNGTIMNHGELLIYRTTYQQNNPIFITDGGYLVVNETSEVSSIIHKGGTVVLHPHTSVHYYIPYNTAGASAPMLSMPEPGSAHYIVDLLELNLPIYVDYPMAQPAMYVYLNTPPSISTPPEGDVGIIIGNAQGGQASNIQSLRYVELGGTLGQPTELNIINSTIEDGVVIIDDLPNYEANNDIYSTVRLDQTEANIRYLLLRNGILEASDTNNIYVHTATIYNGKIVLNGVSLTVDELNVATEPFVIEVNTSTAPIHLSVGGLDENTVIVLSCAGDSYYPLYIDDNMSSNVVLDSSCNSILDTNRNIVIEAEYIPPSVAPDKDYTIIAKVYLEDATYGVEVNVQVVVNDIPYVIKTIYVQPNKPRYLNITLHAPPTAGSQTIKLIVDPENSFWETNENDNTVTATVNIENPPLTDKTVGSTGGGGAAAANVVYVSAELKEQKKTAVHISWKYPYKTKAYIYYYETGADIDGPGVITLEPGDNIFTITVKPYKYGTVGKIVVKTPTTKEEIIVQARPLAQMLPVSGELVGAATAVVLLLVILNVLSKLI